MAFLVALSACGDNLPVILHVDTIDAPVATDAPQDASCVRSVDAGDDDCCRYAPDQAAIATCAAPGITPGACGVTGCQMNDCSFVVVHVCHPPE